MSGVNGTFFRPLLSHSATALPVRCAALSAAVSLSLCEACGEPTASLDEHPLAVPRVTSLTDPDVSSRVPEEHYALPNRPPVET
jgi:hypothetical protein